MIDIRNVSKNYYNLKALDNVSITIPAGEVVGLLGPNGAGKTTLFKLIAGIINPDKGSIRPIHENWPSIGYKSDRLLLPNHLKIHQYLETVAGISNIHRSKIKYLTQQALAKVDLLESANKKIGTCSKGMRQRIGLAQVLIGNPQLLLLDEPSNGLDPEGQQDMLKRIQELHTAGKTIVMSSHQLHEITQACTYLIILNRGQIHYQNSMVNALTISPHALIETERPLVDPMLTTAIYALHPDVKIEGNKIYLQNEAMNLRRDILAMLLRSGYDVIHVEQKHITLAEIYAEAVR